MVVSERRKYYNLDHSNDEEIIVMKIRDKYKKKKNVRTISKPACILMIILLFFLSILLLKQYSKVNTINEEIINIETELEEIQMMNDTKEGMLITNLDLNEIERTAKEELGMVKPSVEQYSYIAVDDVSNVNAEADEEKESTEERVALSWFSRLID